MGEQQSKLKRSCGDSIQGFVLNNKALLILIIMVIVVSFLSPLFLTRQNLLNVIRQVCASIVLGAGFTMLMASGGLDLSVGTMIGFIGIVVAKISLTGIPMFCVVILALLIGCACGALNGAIINVFGLPAFIVTIAMQSVYEGANYLISRNKSVVGIPDGFKFIGQGYLLGIPVPVYIMAVIVAAYWILANKTKFGRYCLATGGNAQAARACGVNTKKISFIAYVSVGLTAAISALILTGRAASAQTGAGSGMDLDIIAGVVIGGTSLFGGNARIVGTIFGCLMIGIINNALNLLNVDSNWQIVAKGLLILFAIVLDSYGERLITRNQGKC